MGKDMYGLNIYYPFEAPMPHLEDPTVRSCQIIVAGGFENGSETTSDDIIAAGQKIIDEFVNEGIEARFEYDYNGKPVTRENLARYFKLKFQNALADLSCSSSDLTVSACTEHLPGRQDTTYATA